MPKKIRCDDSPGGYRYNREFYIFIILVIPTSEAAYILHGSCYHKKYEDVLRIHDKKIVPKSIKVLISKNIRVKFLNEIY